MTRKLDIRKAITQLVLEEYHLQLTADSNRKDSQQLISSTALHSVRERNSLRSIVQKERSWLLKEAGRLVAIPIRMA